MTSQIYFEERAQ